MKVLIAALSLTLLSGVASADEIYTYTGPAPANLSGSFVTETPLVAGSSFGFGNAIFSSVPVVMGQNTTPVWIVETFNFTDGVNVWTPANAVLGGNVGVNPDGTFSVWSFAVSSTDGSGLYGKSQTEYSAFYYEDITPQGNSWNANESMWEKPKGSWTISDDDAVSTPEPSSLLMLGAGFPALALISLRIRAA